MAVNNRRGDTGPLLFVSKSARMPYRQVVLNGQDVIETYASHFRTGAVVAMGDDVEGGGSIHTTF